MDAGPPYKNPALVVAREQADDAIRALHAARLLDPTRRIASDADVTIPVRADPALPDWAARLGARLVDAPALPPREESRAPRDLVLKRLDLPPEEAALVPDKWEQHGDVLVLRLPDALRPRAAEVARAFADVLGLKAVLHDPSGVGGELREMRAELLLGDDPVATHVENGVRYRFDASRIMFSSGNLPERARAAAIRAEGETVVDMFAGIGYFTIPLAMRAKAARVIALEKNPLSFRYLEENARLNGVERVVEPWLGDNREYPREAIAHRVLMGYFPRTQQFLPKALRLLRPEGGVLHYHNTAHAERWREELEGQLREAAQGRAVDVLEARVVKTHSPGVVHAVLVARVGPG